MRNTGKSLIYIMLIMFAAPSVCAGTFSASFQSWLLGPQASSAVIKTEQVRLDAVSAECMQCHNGRDSSHIAIKSADSPMQFSVSGRQSNHPVGMNYDKYAASQPASYRPRSRLSPKISFANGQVACITCHQLKDSNEYESHNAGSFQKVSTASVASVSGKDMCTSRKTLTVGPKKSDLCMSCHAM